MTAQLQKSPGITNHAQLPVKRKLVFEQNSLNDISSNVLFKYLFFIYVYYLIC